MCIVALLIITATNYNLSYVFFMLRSYLVFFNQQNIFQIEFKLQKNRVFKCILVQNFQILEEMTKCQLFMIGVILHLLMYQGKGNSSSPPIWVSSSFFKAGPVNFVWTGSASSQNASITYSSAIVHSSLKVPTMGITNLNYLIVASRLLLQVKVASFSASGLIYQVVVNSRTHLTILSLTYMALDSSFTPAFSMNYFFPNVNQNSSGIYAQFFVNFTASTGVTLNTSHQNVLLPFLHYLDITTRDSTIDLNLNFSLLNGSFYAVIISSSSSMHLRFAGFSRLIFDKTAIEALGNDYFNYGIVSATNNNSTQLSTIIPPNILPANLYYGLHSFSIATGLSALSFNSTYDINTGFIGYTPNAPYVFTKMKFSYMHHKTRTCPAGFPYYNISQVLCYDTCNDGWYGDPVTMTCKQCPYTCYTCINATACATCNNTAHFRTMNGTICSPITGYFDNGTNNTIAAPCSSPCASCVTTATRCLSCVSGFYLSSNSCLSCGLAISNCATCTNSSYCTLCNSGTSGNTCTTCTSTQYLNGSTCVVCSTVINNCQACTSSTTCTLCMTSFTQYSSTNCSCTSTQYLSGGQCVSCSSSINYCSSCTSSNTCTGCISTFVLASPTSCTCNSSAYLNTSSSSCIACITIDPYCASCTNTSCTACVNNLTILNGTCACSSGYYLDTANQICSSCSSAMAQCLTCTSNSVCTSCAAGYTVDPNTFNCVFQPCQIANCHTCNAANYSICTACDTGYSLANSSTQCSVKCGDGSLNALLQACDDGNLISGDGCSSTCQLQTGFTCVSQYINVTNTYSYCYYSGSITFTSVWIRKIQGSNTLKFEFQLGQKINQWNTVDFASILQIDTIDPITNFSTGLGSYMISSYTTVYNQANNRFSVTLNYQNANMQSQYLSFSLHPYDNHMYPAFTPPINVQFFPPNVFCNLKVLANNNQNANLYSSQIYGAYTISVGTTYAVVGIALLTFFTSLFFRAGKVITFQMVILLQLTYFSLSFLDSINPVFSGLLPLRYIAGILNFKDVDDYMEQTTSPNSMKGIYMFFNLSDNFTFIALSIVSFLALGTILLLIYYMIDWLMNKEELGQNTSRENRTGFTLYKLAFHFIGELALSLIIVCLPLYSISIIFQAFYTSSSGDFWSYAMGVGIGIAIVTYFALLVRQSYPKEDEFCKFGEYLSQFTNNQTFKNFKYTNMSMISTVMISTLIILTIYTNNKLFATISIIFISLVDIVLVSVVKPYRYGFVSCFKGEDNDTQSMFQKIELYKIYDKEQPQVIRIQNPDLTQKSQENQNNSDVFAQHFATRKNVIKTKHQGLIQGGEVLNHSKLFLFNNNFRRIFNLVTLIVVQFVFACTAIFSEAINKNYDTVNIQVALPFLIHSFIFLNVIYNYAMLILQILNRTKQTLGKVDNDPVDSSSQFMKSMYSQKEKQKSPDEDQISKSFKTNQDIIKENQGVKSLYDLKRPKIIQPYRSKANLRKTKDSKMHDNKIDEEDD